MTFGLGATSRANLVGVHPKLIAVVARAICITPQDFCVREGLRSIEQERKNVAAGVSRTMNSKHLKQADGFGHAVDLVPWIDAKAQWLWGEPRDYDAAGKRVGGCYAVAAAVREAALEFGTRIRWGGVWDRALNALASSAEGLRAAGKVYTVRHAGSDLLDGPHFELVLK